MTINDAALRELQAAMKGYVLRPGADGYERARRIFNAMIDRRPALIARCERAADIVACIGFARAHGLDVSVKGGGHNVSGKAVCDSGLMIDLSPMSVCRSTRSGAPYAPSRA
jgi:FAD/FMN-containing dehydrogenase